MALRFQKILFTTDLSEVSWQALPTALDLARAFGFPSVDAGPLTNARYLEPLTELLIQLAYGKGLGTSIGVALLRPVAEAAQRQRATEQT